MKRNNLTIIIFIISINIFAQSFQNDFNKAFQEKDTLKTKEILLKWEKTNPKDPELYTSFFNYYFHQSQQQMLTITDEAQESEVLAINDSLGNSVGFFAEKTFYNEAIFQKGIDKIEKGIKLYPDRLDMRFGEIYAYGKTENWEVFTKIIIETIDYSHINKNKWTWANGEKKENGKEFLLSNIQNYQLQLYGTENDSLLLNMRIIAQEILKYYPKHIESLTNLSLTYILLKEYDKGINSLLKAEKINPNDCIVLVNIARGYILKEDIIKAREYYKKCANCDNEQIKEYAIKELEKLKDANNAYKK